MPIPSSLASEPGQHAADAFNLTGTLWKFMRPMRIVKHLYDICCRHDGLKGRFEPVSATASQNEERGVEGLNDMGSISLEATI
jgi:hypothetical protein